MYSRNILFTAVVSIFPVVFPSTAWPQEPIPFVPSPMVVVDRMLELAKVKKGDVVYDLGSGDGRIVIRAARKYGARGVGIDIDPELVELARAKAAEEGVSHLVEFRVGDALNADISNATVVTLYMLDWFNNEMGPRLQRLKPGARVVANDFGIEGWPPSKVEEITPDEDDPDWSGHSHTIFLWKIEG